MSDESNLYKPPPAPRRSHAGTPWLAGLLQAVGSLAWIVIIVVVVVRNLDRGPRRAPTPTYVAGEKVGSVLLWDPQGGDPIVASADVELLVGRMREVPGDAVYVVAFTANGLVRTRVGPLGERDAVGPVVRFVVHDGSIVASVPGQLHVYDLRAGVPARTLVIRGAARRLCEAAGEGSRLVVEDEAGTWVVDVQAGALQAADVSTACKQTPADKLAAVADVTVMRRHAWDDHTIVVGLDAGAPPRMVAVGLTAAGTAAWQTPIAADASGGWDPAATREAHAGDRLIATYDGPDALRRLTAIDAGSGKRLWDVPVRAIVGVDPFAGLVASTRHAYVVRGTSVEVYDTATGAVVATLGSDAYAR